jgi:hypothetical protein
MSAVSNGSDLHEERNEKFKEIAARRVGQVLRSLTLLEQMANSTAYNYSAAEVETMFAVMDRALERARQRYTLTVTRIKPADASKSFHF